MKTNILFATLIGLLGLYSGQILTGIPALIGTIIGFVSVMIACVLSFKQLIKKQDR